tara:strand:+ start:3180 stop:4745 length:1566 start_codon:yes stop_codon:yes gene_type:complete
MSGPSGRATDTDFGAAPRGVHGADRDAIDQIEVVPYMPSSRESTTDDDDTVQTADIDLDGRGGREFTEEEARERAERAGLTDEMIEYLNGEITEDLDVEGAITGVPYVPEEEDYTAEILRQLGESTQVQPLAFYALGGYTLSTAGYAEDRYSDGSGVGTLSPDDAVFRYDNKIRSGVSDGIKTGVLTNSEWFSLQAAYLTKDNPGIKTWRGFELRPFFDLGFSETDPISFTAAPTHGRYDNDMSRNALSMRAGGSTRGSTATDGAIDTGDIYNAAQSTMYEAVNEGFSGVEGDEFVGERGTLADQQLEILGLTGTVGLTAFAANQYPGTDYGVLYAEVEPLSTAVVIGHLGFGADPIFSGDAIQYGTFTYGPTQKKPIGPGPVVSEAYADPFDPGTGLDNSLFAENTYYVCNMFPGAYSEPEMMTLRSKFGYDASTFTDHPYLGTKERIHEGVTQLIIDLMDDVLSRTDVTKTVTSEGLSQIKVNKIEGSEINESDSFRPSGTMTGATPDSTNTGGGTYGY